MHLQQSFKGGEKSGYQPTNQRRIRSVSCFSALSCALGEGRAAISMGRKTGDSKRDRGKVDFSVAHCQWGKKRVCGNRGAIPWMSRHAAIHGALGLIVSRRQRGFRFRRGRTVVVMLVHGAVTVVCCHRMA